MLLEKIFGAVPHTSVVIDVYRTPGVPCGEQPAEKVVYGIQGCEDCLRDCIAQLIATDPKFATFVSECLQKVHPSFKIDSNDNA